MIDRDSDAPSGGERRRRPWRVVVPAAALAVAVSLFGINAMGDDKDNTPKTEQGAEAANSNEKVQETAVNLTKDINQLFEQVQPEGSPDTTSVDGQASISFSVQENESKGYSFGAFVDLGEDGQPDWDSPQTFTVAIHELDGDLPTLTESYTFSKTDNGNWTLNVYGTENEGFYSTDRADVQNIEDGAVSPLDPTILSAADGRMSEILHLADANFDMAA